MANVIKMLSKRRRLVIGVTLIAACGIVGAAAALADSVPAARVESSGPISCSVSCLATKAAISRSMLEGTPAPTFAPDATVRPGIPTVAGIAGVPWDACKTVNNGLGATVQDLLAEYGAPVACESHYYRADGSLCVRLLLAGPQSCAGADPLREVVVLQVEAHGSTPAGFLSCDRSLTYPSYWCGVDPPDNDTLASDRAADWTFSPLPDGASVLSWPTDAHLTPVQPTSPGYPAIARPAGAQGDPVECVGNGTQQWTFHIANHTYVPGKCPAPWN